MNLHNYYPKPKYLILGSLWTLGVRVCNKFQTFGLRLCGILDAKGFRTDLLRFYCTMLLLSLSLFSTYIYMCVCVKIRMCFVCVYIYTSRCIETMILSKVFGLF